MQEDVMRSFLKIELSENKLELKADQLKNKIDYMIRTSDLLDDHMLNLNRKWSKMVIVLNQGYFGLLRKYSVDFVQLRAPHFATESQNHMDVMLTALTGLISAPKDDNMFIS